MKITRIRVFGQDQPFRDGEYRCRNRTEHGFVSTIVAIDTDEGLTGWGEIAPLGAFYSEAFAAGARAGIRILAPELIGADPREIALLVRRMDAAMMGQMDAKTPIDMALWDLAAQSAGLPLAEFLGGREGETVALYRSLSQDTPAAMAAKARDLLGQGYRRLQVKVGADPRAEAGLLHAVADAAGPGVALYADANGAWTSQQALRFVDATREIDYVLEQPCATHEECLIVRRAARKPMVLDETADSLAALLRIHVDGAADGVTLKIARFGGITRTRLARDLAVEFGLMVTIEDIGGAEIDTAAMAHLGLSTPERNRAHGCDFHNWVTVSNATGLPPIQDGRMSAPRAPGLGVAVLEEALGPPLFTIDG